MENQLEYYTETGKYRDRFDQGLPVMAAYSTFRKQVYQDGALSSKVKRLIALAAGLQAGCTRCIQGQTKDALLPEPPKKKSWKPWRWLSSWVGTAVSAETWRVVKVLEELGHKVG